MTVIARDAVAADHLVYAWPFPLGPECEVSCHDDEQVVMCPSWLGGGRLGPGRHHWRPPDPTRPVAAFFRVFQPADHFPLHLYLNYAREHWVRADENPPVGLILCARKDEAVARYALEGLPNEVMAAEYRMALPDERDLAAEIERTQAILQDGKRLSLVWRKKR